MTSRTRAFLALISMLFTSAVQSAEISWTRPTGQLPVECAAILDNRDATNPRLLAVNRVGQVILWNTVSGSAIGDGQDGTVATLPQGEWTSSPVETIDNQGNARLIFVSNDGMIVSLSKDDWSQRWAIALGAKVTWARGTPCQVGEKSVFAIGDLAGKLTTFTSEGEVISAVDLGAPCSAPVTHHTCANGRSVLFAVAGNQLACVDVEEREVVWKVGTSENPLPIITKPIVIATADQEMVVFASGIGEVIALDMDGNARWKSPSHGPLDSTLCVLTDDSNRPSKILFAGLWGNLYALNLDGTLAWVHRFDGKTRSVPRVADFTGDAALEILVGSHNQHAYLLDINGKLHDDIRVNGTLSSPATIVPNATTGKSDAVFMASNSLLAHRITFGTPQPLYRSSYTSIPIQTAKSTIILSSSSAATLSNPDGALLRVNLEGVGTVSGARWTKGSLTARTSLTITLDAPENLRDIRAWVEDINGTLLSETTTLPTTTEQEAPLTTLTTRVVLPYEVSASAPADFAIALYQNEYELGAIAIRQPGEKPIRVRVSIQPPAQENGLVLNTPVEVFELIDTPATNGEAVADALVPLNAAQTLLLTSAAETRILVRVHATAETSPGRYIAKMRLEPVATGIDASETSIDIDVLPLKLEPRDRLAFCTWDYIPNQWFPDNEEAVIQDMLSHGVNVFPRTRSIPTAKANADGTLTFDWTILNDDLALLGGRGTILFQIMHPPITFVEGTSDADKRKLELDYFHQWRDYMRKKGLRYEDYAFYILDEPGLDYGKSIPLYLDAAQLFREADPKFRIYVDPVPTLAWDDYENLKPFIDLWCPNMRLVSGLVARDPRIESIMNTGTPVWSYECVAQVKSLSPLRYNRSNAWRAQYFGLDGIGLWTYSTTQRNHWLPGDAKAEEYALVYPGEKPIASLRWEAARDGLEDIAALRQLERQIAESELAGKNADTCAKAKDAIRRTLVTVAELSDPAFVESRDYLEEGNRRIWHTQADAELFLRLRAEIAALARAL